MCPGKWSFSAACSEAWASNGTFADMVEEFIAGTDPELAAAVEGLLEAVCECVGCHLGAFSLCIAQA